MPAGGFLFSTCRKSFVTYLQDREVRAFLTSLALLQAFAYRRVSVPVIDHDEPCARCICACVGQGVPRVARVVNGRGFEVVRRLFKCQMVHWFFLW